jgi:hypothetical protein
VVIPSPVHYDRAGRRVIDPGWQETMYRMIQAERETQAAAQGMPPVQETQGSEETPGPGPLSQTEQAAGADQERVRETVILVPGPVTWRIRGTLTVAKGMLALEDAEGVLWYLPGLDRYIGYIDGLDAGEEAVLEGYAPPRGSSQERYFQPLRLFIDEMEYDLAVPPEGIYLGGSATVIREVERRDGAAGRNSGEARPGGRIGRTLPRQADNYGDGLDGDDRDEWEDIPAARGRQPGNRPPARPAWEHNHRSPWAPPSGVLDFKVDNDSFWRDDPARQERRERDSREIWY